MYDAIALFPTTGLVNTLQVFVPELLKQGQWSGDATTAQIHSIVEITASVAGVRFGAVGQ